MLLRKPRLSSSRYDFSVDMLTETFFPFHLATAAPKINRDLMPSVKDIKVKVGEEFKIAVPYNGNPIPTVSWLQVIFFLQ